jgi:hypothetical protein
MSQISSSIIDQADKSYSLNPRIISSMTPDGTYNFERGNLTIPVGFVFLRKGEDHDVRYKLYTYISNIPFSSDFCKTKKQCLEEFRLFHTTLLMQQVGHQAKGFDSLLERVNELKLEVTEFADRMRSDSLDLSNGPISPPGGPQLTRKLTKLPPLPVKDLTRYGIEPNPGPGSKVPKRKLKPGVRKRVRRNNKKSDSGVVNKAISTTVQTARVRGRGGYIGDMATRGGAGLGSWIGGKLGGMAGRLFESVTGLGSYSTPAAGLGNSPPIFNSKGAPIIEHREFLGDITGSVAFSIASYDLNPGLSSTFPWLYSLANNFEEYRLLGTIFEFKSTSATALNSTNTALGTVIMATEYDSYDIQFANKLEMENHVFSSSAAPSLSQLHPIECAPSQTTFPQRYVRTSSVPDGADRRLYDWGRFSIATVGMQAAAVVGELWCTYRVQLLKPTMNPVGVDVLYTNVSFGSVLNTNVPFPSTLITQGVDNTFAMSRVSDTVLAFPPTMRSGYFVVVHTFTQASAFTAPNPYAVTGTNCTCSAVTSSPQAGLAGISSYSAFYGVTITNNGAYLTCANGSSALTTNTGSFSCYQIPNIALKKSKAPLAKLYERLALLESKFAGEHQEQKSDGWLTLPVPKNIYLN